VRGAGKKSAPASQKRKKAGGRVKKDDTRVSTLLEVRGSGKKRPKKATKAKVAKSSKAKKEGTRVSTILDVRAAGKSRTSTRRINTSRDGSKS
jgi:hypothetical protein